MGQKRLSVNIFVYITVIVSMILFSAISVYAAQPAVDLGTAGNFVILAKSGISTIGTTSIVGDIGVSPIDSTAITGFGLILDSSNVFSTSSLVTGKVYASNYAVPTPTVMTTAVSDMETAYTDAAGRTLPDYVELGAGNIGGMTLAPGLYKWSTGVIIPTDVILSGSSTDVWIFQIAQTLDISSGKHVNLSGGAQAKNIFWQVAGKTTLGTTSEFNGNILDQTAIVLNTGATLNGRALAQTAVTLDSNTIFLKTVNETSTENTTEQNSTAVCGDGIITSNEQCDAGVNNGIVCRPQSGKSCVYCNDSCNNVTVRHHSHTPPPITPPSGVPEFSLLTIGAAILVVTLGLVILRKN
jgi:hypothetical protein